MGGAATVARRRGHVTTDWWGENDGIGTTDGGMLGGDECAERRERWRGMGWKTEVEDKDKLPGGQLDLFDLV